MPPSSLTPTRHRTSCTVGIDAVTSTMVNVSVWHSLEHAQQMSTLAPMLALASDFKAFGVEFDPITNYETL